MRLRRGFSVCVQGTDCFQSYGFGQFRALGRLDCLLQNLDRHEVDELMIISPHSNPVDKQFKPVAMNQLADKYVSVPLIQAGYLEHDSVLDLHSEIGFCERFVFTRALYEKDTFWIDRYTQVFGAQAIIGCLPIHFSDSGGPMYFCDGKSRPLTQADIDYALTVCDEVIVQQINRFGTVDGFDTALFLQLEIAPERVILNGGVGPQTAKYAASKGFAAVYFDNPIFHQEGGL